MLAATHQPVTQELIRLVGAHPGVGDELLHCIGAAALPDIHDLAGLYVYVDELVTTIPDGSSRLTGIAMEIYYLTAHSDRLLQDSVFQTWLVNVACAWGAFLDTPASTSELRKYYEDPRYRIEDYDPGPSGWLSFNQFFARLIRPGARPIALPLDPNAIVAACDGSLMETLPINDDAEIVSKGISYKLSELLDHSEYAEHFDGGTFTHTFLDTADYHRYHTPVAGRVLEARTIAGEVEIQFERVDGRITPKRALSAGYLFTQARGLLVLDSSAGLIAIAPIGMAQISSVTISPRVGVQLQKGEQFGYFQFGGSDVVVLCQRDRVTMQRGGGDRLLQGELIATVNHRSTAVLFV